MLSKFNVGLFTERINDIAVIDIGGELINTNRDIPLGYPYVSIQKLNENIKTCKDDNSVNAIVLKINCPGGSVFGITDVVKTIKSLDKPIISICGYFCTSAAYWIASATNKIVATTDISYFGSIGVISYNMMFDFEYWTTNKLGYKKAPDIRSDDGKIIIQENLDKIYEVFIEDVSLNRKISTEEAKSNFGDGNSYLPKEAIKLGLIDELNYSPDISDYFNTNSSSDASNLNANDIKKMIKDSLSDIHI